MMYCYFSSAYPAAIKLNGAFFGRCDGDPRGINIEEKSVFAEICPLNGGAASSFLLDENFLSAPPPFASVADLKGGYLIRFYVPPTVSDFKIVAQKKYPSALITVFYDNGLKASIETPFGMISDNFRFNAGEIKISEVRISDKDVVTVFFSQENALYLYDITEKPEKLGVIFARSFTEKNGFLYTTYIKKDIAGHKTESRWEIKDGAVSEAEKTVSVSEEFDRTAVPDILIPYVFFEELSVGGDYAYYLSEEVKENADKLKSYFGEFLSIMPPPPFRDRKEIGLIYKAGENKYSVDYATVEISGGKITNLKRSK